MTSMYAAAMPVAASAIAPTRPPGLAYSHHAAATSAAASTRSAGDAELRAQNACLGGQHEQQHDADQGDRDAGDGEHLADPALGTFLPRLRRRRWRRNVWTRRARSAAEYCGQYGTAGGTYGWGYHPLAVDGCDGATGWGAGGCSDSSGRARSDPLTRGPAAARSRRSPRTAGKRRHDAAVRSWRHRRSAQAKADE